MSRMSFFRCVKKKKYIMLVLMERESSMGQIVGAPEIDHDVLAPGMVMQMMLASTQCPGLGVVFRFPSKKYGIFVFLRGHRWVKHVMRACNRNDALILCSGMPLSMVKIKIINVPCFFLQLFCPGRAYFFGKEQCVQLAGR
jgi:hypothetical protein